MILFVSFCVIGFIRDFDIIQDEVLNLVFQYIYWFLCFNYCSLLFYWYLNRKIGEVIRMVDRGVNSIYNFLKCDFYCYF